MKTLSKLVATMLLAAQMTAVLPAVPGFAQGNRTADDMFIDADAADTAHNFPAAVEKYKALIKLLKVSDPLNPKRLRAQARLARLYVENNDFDAAEPLFLTLIHMDRAAILKDPEVMIDLDDLSDTYIALENDPHYGLESLKRTLTLREFMDPTQPHLPEVYLRLANYYLKKLHDPKTSAVYAEKLVAFDHHSALRKKAPLAYDLVMLSSIYATMKDFTKARNAAVEGIAASRQCNCGKESIVSFNEILRLCDLHDKSSLKPKLKIKSH